jgi:ubiquinone/menaquinone biosynthesis C-methylase UbiE
MSAAIQNLIGMGEPWLDRARYMAERYGILTVFTPLIKVWHTALDPHAQPPRDRDMQAIDQRFRELLERDLDNARRGVYPRELLFELPILRYLRMAPYGLLEFPRILWRKKKKRMTDLPDIEDRSLYPDYYLRNFHWQSDGWLSERSARLYDAGVEALFLGTADVMRRMVIPPVVKAVASSREAYPRILDVACGTGRFLYQLRQALPQARLYGLDLSPFYIDEAKALLKSHPGVSLVTENAERLPFQDGYFDAVTSMFLFHELPRNARRRVMKEALRVLRPGGSFVALDSAQLSESMAIRVFLEEFPALYHEPYYRAYLRDDLGEALLECGFEQPITQAHFVAKTVVARKPSLDDRKS